MGGFGGESSHCKGILSGKGLSVTAEGSYKLGGVHPGR
jgi:hypothetical protein